MPTKHSLLYDNILLLDNAAKRATGTTKQLSLPGTTSQIVQSCEHTKKLHKFHVYKPFLYLNHR
jgi:hypothetical protein